MRNLASIVATCGLLLSGCDATGFSGSTEQPARRPTLLSAKDGKGVPLTLTGIDHLADHVSVQNFSVNGTSGMQAGKGGREVCCVSVPAHWRPGLMVDVRWGVLNWRDRSAGRYRAIVELERYTEPGQLYVHFLPDGKVRVVTSMEGPRSPDYPGPRDPIPQKYPWDVYDLPGGTKLDCKDFTQQPPVPCPD